MRNPRFAREPDEDDLGAEHETSDRLDRPPSISVMIGFGHPQQRYASEEADDALPQMDERELDLRIEACEHELDFLRALHDGNERAAKKAYEAMAKVDQKLERGGDDG